MKEKYLKLGFVLILAFLLLTAGFYVKELRQKEKLVKDYQKLSDLYNQKVFEYEKEIKELKEKGELIIKPEENLTPREVVEGFIKADMAGARLGGEIAKEAPGIEEYSTLSALGPGSDTLMIIKKYEIIEEYPSIDGSSYYARVKFFCKEGAEPSALYNEKGEVIGGTLKTIPCSSFFNPSADPFWVRYDLKTQIETINFKLIRADDKGRWKIDEPFFGIPHISEETLKKLLEEP